MFRGTDYEAVAEGVWTPPPGTDGTGLEQLVHHARLAANSHNTQPWRFSAKGDEIRITPDVSRRTPVVDPDDHHLFASLGCAGENLLLAAGAQGRRAAVVDAGAAGITVGLGGSGPAADPLFAAIPQRQCSRSDYDGSALSVQELSALRAAARIEGCDLVLLTERGAVEAVLELIVAGNEAQIADPAFVNELLHWLRFSGARAAAMGDGLYAGCSGNPTMPQWLGELVFPYVFKVTGENEKVTRQVRSSAGLAVFVSEKNDPGHWIAAGRSYQRFALQAAALGIRTAFVNQPVEVASLRPTLAGLLSLGSVRPDFVVRFGRGPAMPRSLRRPVKDVIDTA